MVFRCCPPRLTVHGSFTHFSLSPSLSRKPYILAGLYSVNVSGRLTTTRLAAPGRHCGAARRRARVPSSSSRVESLVQSECPAAVGRSERQGPRTRNRSDPNMVRGRLVKVTSQVAG